ALWISSAPRCAIAVPPRAARKHIGVIADKEKSRKLPTHRQCTIPSRDDARGQTGSAICPVKMARARA
ncbi:MAG: hypothetical protein O7C66_03440, partial [Alphaproteobacteria bacterium]|nr:hypothetical protein [Alphaproteobacteria bacterium]